MIEQKIGKLNLLERKLPEGLVVDAAWMEKHEYSSSLRSHYVTAGWLEQPIRGVYKKPFGTMTWEKVIISLQTLMERPLIVGGRTALELQGLGHYLQISGPPTIHLYGYKPPPGWLKKLRLKERFIFHRTNILFKSDPVTKGLTNFVWDIEKNKGENVEGLRSGGLRPLYTQAEWPLTISSAERAFLELLNELPKRETFHNVDMIAESLGTLSPRRMQKLLEDCKSVKVKRLFFWFIERHNHRWLNQIDRTKISLGSGKRVLIKGGKFDQKYLITVPEELSGSV